MEMTQEVLALMLLSQSATVGAAPLRHLASGSDPAESGCEVSSCSGGGGVGMICLVGPRA